MSLFKKRYRVVSWYGKVHRLTAKQLYERIMEDSKSDYNWIASATELVKACNQFDSSEEMYSREIKVAILNCFANLEQGISYGHTEPTDENAVYSCYNSLLCDDEKVLDVKQKYLKAFISKCSRVPFWDNRPYIFLNGDTFKTVQEDWRTKKISEIHPKKKIDFQELTKELKEDFAKTIKSAYDEGAFKEDEEQLREEIKKLWARVDKNI